MKTRDKIIGKLKSIEKYHGVEILQIENENKYGSCASYDYISNKIRININGIKKEYQKICVQYKNKSRFEEFVDIILLHEIGHAKDKKIGDYWKNRHKYLYELEQAKNIEEIERLIIELGSNILQSEIDAWQYAENYVKEKEKMFFKYFRDKCIEKYIRDIEYLKENYVIVLEQKTIAK